MKQINQIALLLALLIGFSSQAKADLLVEPVVGFNLGSKFEIENSDSYTGGTGGAFGARLGYQNLGFQLGLDYLNSSINMDDNDFDENVSLSEFAGFVGFEFPILVRVYAGYIFSANGETTKNDATVKVTEGTGTKFGIGFTGLPFIDINLEFRSGKFGSLESDGTEFNNEVTYQSMMLGLSAPFAF